MLSYCYPSSTFGFIGCPFPTMLEGCFDDCPLCVKLNEERFSFFLRQLCKMAVTALADGGWRMADGG
jgi:hypothetical protein